MMDLYTQLYGRGDGKRKLRRVVTFTDEDMPLNNEQAYDRDDREDQQAVAIRNNWERVDAARMINRQRQH